MVSRSRALRTLRMHESPDVFFHKKLPSHLLAIAAIASNVPIAPGCPLLHHRKALRMRGCARSVSTGR